MINDERYSTCSKCFEVSSVETMWQHVCKRSEKNKERRERIATQVLAGFASRPNCSLSVLDALTMADALIKELDRE